MIKVLDITKKPDVPDSGRVRLLLPPAPRAGRRSRSVSSFSSEEADHRGWFVRVRRIPASFVFGASMIRCWHSAHLK